MILATHYAIKGIKKGHKKYKLKQAEKEQKRLEERGQLPRMDDPSRELDMRCLADVDRHRSTSSTSTKSSSSSDSTRSAERALQNDPEFKRYMEQHKSMYIQQQREKGLPPSYNAVIQEGATPISSTYGPTSAESPSSTHCACHECITRTGSNGPHLHSTSSHHISHASVQLRTSTPQPHRPSVAELPDTQMSRSTPAPPVAELDDNSFPFELPGNLPAMLPPSKHDRRAAPVELPTQPS